MENKTIKDRILLLQQIMTEKKIDIYIIPTSDYHNSEYVGEYFKVREFFSGFDGSNGTLVVTKEACGLWTDGRYFIQAENELIGTDISLYKMGNANVPTIAEYIAKQCQNKKMVIGFDGRVCSSRYIELLLEKSSKDLITLYYEEDLSEKIWKDRPLRACEPIMVLPENVTGKSMAEKLELVRKAMKEKNAEGFLLSKLDDIMWLYNIRGGDVACNPVALTYTFITQKEQFLFIQRNAVGVLEEAYFKKNGVILLDYDSVFSFLKNYTYNGSVLADDYDTSYSLSSILKERTELIFTKNVTELLKAVKNETEQQVMYEYYLKDSAAVCKFIYHMKTEGEADEVSAGAYLDALRKKIPGFMGLSFPTICAYRENAAMMHYEAGEANNKKIAKESMLLVDSGGQYMGATTDVTRTICLGTLTSEEKKYFTLVAVSMLRLMNAVFLYGCSGRNLDILARGPLWNCYVDYKCGTGHGVGAFLNVHEGPQNIRWKYIPYTLETVLEEGMLVTDEPGVYFEHKFGIRTENVLLTKKLHENEDGSFMGFETLTFAPIDLDGIAPEYMNEDDKKLLNAYHEMVYQKMKPFLSEDEQKWLKEATRRI